MDIKKVKNTKRIKFLNGNGGWTTPIFLYEGIANDGITYHDPKRKGVINWINRINRLLISRPELFEE